MSRIAVFPACLGDLHMGGDQRVELREIGRTGVHVPVVGQGTWKMGVDRAHGTREVEALRTGIDAGLTLIDTAEMYADGGAERVVGEAVRDCRDAVFLVTKVWPTHADYDGVLRSAAASLKRLRTTHIDLYLLHWPSASHPVSETMRAMNTLVESGDVRYVGVSNFSPELLREAQDALGDKLITCDQVSYHLKNRSIEKTLLPYCNEKGITVMAHSPFGQGDFPSPGTPQRETLDNVARAHDRTPFQVALNWIVSHDGVVAIPKASERKHVIDNATAVDFTLSPEEMGQIEAAFPLPEGEYQVRRM